MAKRLDEIAGKLFPRQEGRKEKSASALSSASVLETAHEIGATEFPEVPTKIPGEDELLFKEFMSGVDSAFLRLYAKYELPLLHYCRRVVPSSEYFEDAFQECWIRIFQLRERDNGYTISNFRALLFKSARNACYNAWRAAHETGKEELQDYEVPEEISGKLEDDEIKSLMMRGLAKLPFEQREAFVLREYSGYSFPEIAEMLGEETATVKVRAFRAKVRLRKFIAGWLGLGEEDDPSLVI